MITTTMPYTFYLIVPEEIALANNGITTRGRNTFYAQKLKDGRWATAIQSFMDFPDLFPERPDNAVPLDQSDFEFEEIQNP